MLDTSVEPVPILGIEGWRSDQHFAQEAAETPPIGCFTIPLSFNDLRGQIFSGTAQTLRLSSSLNVLLREAEVSDFYITVPVNEHILWLQVPVDDVLGVEVFDTKEDVRSVKPCCIFFEPANLTKIKEQFATWAVIDHKVEFGG